MVIPNLDAWMKEEMPKNVEVFSVNVFEQNPESAKEYFQEKKFRLKLLIGNDEIASAYGVNSIPYICVIDKTGKIAYDQLGFTYDLEDNLSIWVEALTKE